MSLRMRLYTFNCIVTKNKNLLSHTTVDKQWFGKPRVHSELGEDLKLWPVFTLHLPQVRD